MEIPVFAYVLLKLAARCNLNCSYCYWFRDQTVYQKPKVLEEQAEIAFCERLEDHVRRYRLPEFTILFHGGEPLLFGKRRFATFQERLGGVAERTGCKLVHLLTTNGTLLDAEWAGLFKQFDVHVSVSVDGPPAVHDSSRVDFRGRGTYYRTLRGIEVLEAAGVKPGVIAVCNPSHDPALVLSHIVDDLGVTNFDILPPDATRDDAVRSIAPYYLRLFDVWYDHYAARGVRVRILSGILQGLFGGRTVTDSIGYGPVHTVTMLTDGALEPLDVLRIAGDGSTRTTLNIRTHTFQDVERSPRWMQAFNASLELCETCNNCALVDACGGGHLAHRWSQENGYDNPSVYCEDWKQIFEHAWRRVAPEILVRRNGLQTPLHLVARSPARCGAPAGSSAP